MNCIRNPFGIISSFMQTIPDLDRQAVSWILWAKFSENCIPSILLSWFSIIIFLYIRICEALSEGTFLFFEKKHFLTQFTRFSEITLKVTFRDWMERLIWVVTYKGHYYPENKSWLIYFYSTSFMNRDAKSSWNTLYFFLFGYIECRINFHNRCIPIEVLINVR
jgi:hypothetical protein